MKDRGIKKMPKCSWIEGHKMVHVFLCRRQITSIDKGDLCKVGEIGLEDEGGKVSSRFKNLLNAVEGWEKELFLCHHGETLAIAFGLLNMPHGTTIRPLS